MLLGHTCCLSSSTLKIDLFSMAFLELQWLVSLSLGHQALSPTLALEPCPPPCLCRWPSGCRTTRRLWWAAPCPQRWARVYSSSMSASRSSASWAPAPQRGGQRAVSTKERGGSRKFCASPGSPQAEPQLSPGMESWPWMAFTAGSSPPSPPGYRRLTAWPWRGCSALCRWTRWGRGLRRGGARLWGWGLGLRLYL